MVKLDQIATKTFMRSIKIGRINNEQINIICMELYYGQGRKRTVRS